MSSGGSTALGLGTVGRASGKEEPLRNREFAVIGLGRFGFSVAKTLVDEGHTVLGIDRDPSLTQRYSHELTQTVSLDTTDEAALMEIGIGSYGTVIVAIGTDFESSLMTCQALSAVGVDNIVCKAASLRHRDILRRVGVDRVILPEHEGGERLARELANPGIVASIQLCAETSATELEVPNSLVGITLESADLAGKYGVYAVALVRNGKASVPVMPKTRLEAGDLLVVVGPNAATRALGKRG